MTGVLELAGKTFTVSTVPFGSYPGGVLTLLTGKRGGQYFLRPFMGEHDGSFEVVSEKTGAPLRDRSGRAVVVVRLGDVIERKEGVTA